MRLLAVFGAVLAALAVYAIVEVGFGLDLRQPVAEPGRETKDIDANHVALAAAVGAVAGWALLAGLERLTARARPVWTVVAVLALVGSLGGPLSGSGISFENRLALVAMHIVVAAAVIPALRRTSPTRTQPLAG